MNAHAKVDLQQITGLIHQKEQEWRSLFQEQIESLAQELGERDEQLRLEKIRFHKLKEDFEYNLGLLAERDKELEHYDELFRQLKANDTLKSAELSEMKITVDESHNKYKQLQKEAAETYAHYQMRLQQFQDEMTKFYTKKEVEVDSGRNEYEELKKKLTQKIRDVEEEKCFESHRLLNEYNDALKQKEVDFRIHLDKKECENHSLLLKIKMLTKELEMVKSTSTKSAEDLENISRDTLKLEKYLKEKDWELEDLKNMQKIKCKELEVKNEELKNHWKIREEELIRKCNEMQKRCIEHEDASKNLKDTFESTEDNQRNEIRNLQTKLQEQELFIKKLQWNITDKVDAKNNEINRLEEEHYEIKLKYSQLQEVCNKISVSKDLQIEALKSSEDQLKQDIIQMKNDINRYKKDLSALVERERLLENAKAQLELEWRRRFENKESALYHEHEDLIRTLTNSREDAVSQLAIVNCELTQRDELIKMLQKDKHKALKCLEKHGVSSEEVFKDVQRGGHDTDNTEDILAQNNQMKEVISQMRSDMEMLTQQAGSRSPIPTQPTNKSNYVQDIENELQEMKAKNRSLENKINDLTKEGKPPSGKLSPKPNNSVVQNHVKELNETIGSLRNDKVQLTAMLKTKDATIAHFKDIQFALEQENHKLEAVIEGLKYDLNSVSKTKEETVKSMTTKTQCLELHLQQARSEAETYYKSIVEQNLNAVHANSKLSEFKLQQTISPQGLQVGHQITNDSQAVKNLKTKLKIAIKRIEELTSARTQLINVGNKLRAELTILKASTNAYSEPDHLNSKKDNFENLQKYKKNAALKPTSLGGTDHSEAEEASPTGNEIQIIKQNKTESVLSPVESKATDNAQPTQCSSLQNSIVMSSSGHSSLKELWNLLEKDDLSTTQTTTSQTHEHSDGVAVVGKQIAAHERSANKQSSFKSGPKSRKLTKKSKIRNYNKKEDGFS